MKPCSKCKVQKELSAFGKWSKGKDGHRPDCKQCRQIESQQQKANQNARCKARYATDEKYRTKVKERQKRYNPASNTRMKGHIKNYSDTYVIAAIKRGTDLKTKDIRQHPELISAWRETMKVRKLIKTENEKRKRVKRKANPAVQPG